MKRPYRKVTGDEWLSVHSDNYPDAVHDTDKTEYILSCNAQDYIAENWPQEVT